MQKCSPCYHQRRAKESDDKVKKYLKSPGRNIQGRNSQWQILKDKTYSNRQGSLVKVEPKQAMTRSTSNPQGEPYKEEILKDRALRIRPTRIARAPCKGRAKSIDDKEYVKPSGRTIQGRNSQRQSLKDYTYSNRQGSLVKIEPKQGKFWYELINSNHKVLPSKG